MRTILFAAFFLIGLLTGAEIVVGPQAPYKSIKAGIAAMKAGDTLMIEPGEYFESVEVNNPPGKPGVTTVIRARRPGSVLLRGDKPAPRFTRVPGSRFIYAAPWQLDCTAVNERDTLKILLPSGTKDDLEYTRGRYFYDAKNKTLYISTTDGEEPDKHFYTVSVLRGSGLFLYKPVNVLIEGLMVTGFYSAEKLTKNIASSSYGIRINYPQNSTVRNCVSFLNANGIHSGHGDGGVIENCVVYANGAMNPSSGGNITVWGPVKNAVVRNCISFYGTQPDGHMGIRLYSGPAENCRLENNISFGQQGVTIKAQNVNSWCIGNFSTAGIHSINAKGNAAFGGNAYRKDSNGILRLDRIRKKDLPKLFADPENYDFRPQSGANLAGGLADKKDVYFISPIGDDAAEGRSVENAWKSLKNVKPGTTVYLLPGVYENAELNVPRVTLRTRGTGAKAVFRGNFSVKADQVTLRDVNFIQGNVRIEGNKANLRCCGFTGMVKITGKECSVTHCAFLQKPALAADCVEHSNLVPGLNVKPLYSNAQMGDFTVKNPADFAGRGQDALPLGPYRLVREAKAAKIYGPFIRSVTASTADIEWWTDREDVSSELRWSSDPGCAHSIGAATSGGCYHTATLCGLKPGKKYYFRIASRSPLREHHSNSELALLDEFKVRELVKSPVCDFTTASKNSAPQEFFVKPGMSISSVLAQAKAGDTVTVADGVYSEHILFRSGGDAKAPITLRAAHPGKVVIDGRAVIGVTMSLENQSNIIIDGFTFRNLNDSDGACIKIKGGSNITIRRCFSDGRRYGYTPCLVEANVVKNLTLDNCVIIRGFKGGLFWRCPGLTLRNCVWHDNQICHIYVHNAPCEKVLVENNLISENIPSKHTEALFGFWHLESAVFRNCAYSLRLPQMHRALVSYTRCGEELVSRKANLATFQKEGGKASGICFADPQWKILPRGLLKFKNPPPLTQKSITGDFHYNKEALILEKTFSKIELGESKKGFVPWEITDFISRNPELLKKNIGLEPVKFQ